MDGNFSNRVRDVISYSREEAIRLGHDYIGTEHLLLGIIREGEGIAVKILRNLGCDLFKLKKSVDETVRSTGGTPTVGNIPLTKQAEKVLKITYLEAKLYKSDVIGTEHLLLSLLRDEENIAAQILQQGFSITYDAVRAELDAILSGRASAPRSGPAPSGGRSSGGGGSSREKKMAEKSKTPVLDNFGRDLTKLAEEGKLDPIVGREREIDDVALVRVLVGYGIELRLVESKRQVCARQHPGHSHTPALHILLLQRRPRDESRSVAISHRRAMGQERVPVREVEPDGCTFGHHDIAIDALVDRLVQLRARARADKRFDDADAIRDGLEQAGVSLEDGPRGTRWVRK